MRFIQDSFHDSSRNSFGTPASSSGIPSSIHSGFLSDASNRNPAGAVHGITYGLTLEVSSKDLPRDPFTVLTGIH